MLPALEAVLAGRDSAMLPVPADDERQTRLLTTSLRAGEDIDDDVAVVVSTSGTTGTPKGAMLTAAALTASADATHRRLGGPGRWLLALPAHHIAGLQVLVRSVIAGSAPVAVSSRLDVAELPAAVSAMGPGRRYASLVAAQLDKALADRVRQRGARRTGRGADRRRTDAGCVSPKRLRPSGFRWFGHTA